MNRDGSNLYPLPESKTPSNGSYSFSGIQWSPDGTKLAFVSDVGLTPEIFVAEADGSNPVQVTDNDYPDYWIVWSSDSQQIAFVSKRDGNSEIYLMNADGSDQRNLTNDPSEDYNPLFSAADSQLSFASNRASQFDDRYYVMDASGSNVSEREGVSFRTLSPDGNLLVFIRSSDNSNIYVANADGSDPQKLTHFTDSHIVRSLPVWSPDGHHLAFTSLQDGDFGIYLVGFDGSNMQKLTDRYNSQHPVWAPLNTPNPLTAVVAAGNGTINARGGPGTDFAIVDGIANITNRCLIVIGRNGDSTWVKLRNPFSTVETVWVSASLLDVRGDLSSVEILDE